MTADVQDQPRGFPDWDVPAAIDTPAVVVDHARMQANIERMAERLRDRGVALRPHAKTHKSLEIARRQLAAGAVGITVATIGEAETFVSCGIEDVFIAYPVWAGGAKGPRLGDLLGTGSVRVGLDSPEAAPHLADAARASGGTLQVLVEVDAGERRTGVTTPGRAVEVARAAARVGLEVVGVFTHGGHAYAAPAAVEPAAQDEVAVLAASVAALAEAGFSPLVVSAGSTPTALLSAHSVVTEERPGTFVFGDRQQALLGAHDAADVALFVAATCVSRESPGRFVLDAGAKAFTKDAPRLLEGFGALPRYPDARITALYDHHAVAESRGGSAPRLGEVVAVVPNHVCPVVNLAEELLVLEDGVVAARWSVDARGRSR